MEKIEDESSKSKTIRRFTRALSLTTEHLEHAVEDVNNLMDIHEKIEEVLAHQTTTAVQKSPPPAPCYTADSMQRKIGSTMLDPKRIIFRDKVTFLFGVTNVALSAFILGKSPENFYHYWTAKCIVLFTLRWLTYKKKGWHYLMLELCYAGNVIGILYCYFFQYSSALRKLTFAYGAGPLMWSILAMRNSLVFHSVDHMTTLMMHASPAITAWTFRWHPKTEWADAVLAANGATRTQDKGWFLRLFQKQMLSFFFLVSYVVDK